MKARIKKGEADPDFTVIGNILFFRNRFCLAFILEESKFWRKCTALAPEDIQAT